MMPSYPYSAVTQHQQALRNADHRTDRIGPEPRRRRPGRPVLLRERVGWRMVALGLRLAVTDHPRPVMGR